MNINKLISNDLKIAFYKSNKNLRYRLKIIVLKISQSMRARNNTFIYLTNFQMSFSDVEIIFFIKLVYQDYYYIKFIFKRRKS